MAVNHSNAQLVQKKVVRSVSGSGLLKIVLRNLVLGILLGLVFRKAVDLVLFPMVIEAWKSLNSALRRLTLLFIVNIVVLLVLVASGFFSPSRGAQGDPTTVGNKKLRAAGKQRKRSNSGRFQNRPNRLEPKAEGKDLSPSLVKFTRDQKKQSNLTDHSEQSAVYHLLQRQGRVACHNALVFFLCGSGLDGCVHLLLGHERSRSLEVDPACALI
ncbi:hypothetical protein O6H91_12G104500 [Diphasiastrum complanatum]|uniref:Uncharacterized protein n=1 Tax=Diphasiastrum complanatum TaxID=34168 RepID=A0ACC2C5D8_DIPCM|nr:hypothetical protein O6H91_12G104500 [Diphasiastrum complanatum]